LDVTPSIRPLVARLVTECRVEPAYGAFVLSLLERAAAEGGGQRTITLLPALTCACHGGDPGRAVPLCAAWLLVRLAAKLLDDVEDGDLDRDQPLHVNASTGLLELAHLSVGALDHEAVPQPRIALIGAKLSRAVLRSAGGQHRDLSAATEAAGLDPDGWLAMAAAKSGALFAWAAWAGAEMAGARGARLEGYRRFGECLGVLLQVADDYNDVWAPEAEAHLRPDVPIPSAPNLAMAYARLVADDVSRRRLDEGLQRARGGDRDALTAAAEALTDLGAQTFVLAAGQAQHHHAVEALSDAGGRPEFERQLLALLDGVMPALQIVADAPTALKDSAV